MDKDWTGNSKSTFANLGASNHSTNEREANDYYATDPKAARLLLEVEEFSPLIWECACGEGHLAKEFEKAGHVVWATDKVNRGYGAVQDFLSTTAPPYLNLILLLTHPISMLLNLSSMLWIFYSHIAKWLCS